MLSQSYFLRIRTVHVYLHPHTVSAYMLESSPAVHILPRPGFDDALLAATTCIYSLFLFRVLALHMHVGLIFVPCFVASHAFTPYFVPYFGASHACTPYCCSVFWRFTYICALFLLQPVGLHKI